ncbi:hypothetical protein C8F01DRAFT_1085127 [Mycena amicta]|nr:hypothetical protein C8F01DRAFT_1085127 [Mycena amicta]
MPSTPKKTSKLKASPSQCHKNARVHLTTPATKCTATCSLPDCRRNPSTRWTINQAQRRALGDERAAQEQGKWGNQQVTLHISLYPVAREVYLSLLGDPEHSSSVPAFYLSPLPLLQQSLNTGSNFLLFHSLHILQGPQIMAQHTDGQGNDWWPRDPGAATDYNATGPITQLYRTSKTARYPVALSQMMARGWNEFRESETVVLGRQLREHDDKCLL